MCEHMLLFILACSETEQKSSSSTQEQSIDAIECIESGSQISFEQEHDGFSWATWFDQQQPEDAQFVALSWVDEVEDCAVVWFEVDQSTAQYVSSEDPQESVGDSSCFDSIDVQGILFMESGDGRIDEAISLTLSYALVDQGEDRDVTFHQQISLEGWQGSLNPTSFYDGDADYFFIEGEYSQEDLKIRISVGDSDIESFDQSLIVETNGICEFTDAGG